MPGGSGVFTHQDLLDKQKQKYEHERRDIDAAQIWKDIPNGPKRRLGDPIKEITNHVDAAITGVDHLEGDQPA